MTSDQAVELRNSLLWRELLKEIDKFVEYETQKLLFCTDKELPQIQERVKALQKVTRLPQDIIEREEQVQ